MSRRLLLMTAAFSLTIVVSWTYQEKCQRSTAPNINSIEDSVGPKELYLIGLFPYSGYAWHGGLSLMVAARLAENQINNRQVIPGYNLNICSRNTKCDPGMAVDVVYEELYDPLFIKMAILGAGCPAVSEAVARVAHFRNLVQVSYTSFISAKSRSEFPLFVRLYPEDHYINKAFVDLLIFFNWKRISVIYEYELTFSQEARNLLNELEEHDLKVIWTEAFRFKYTKREILRLKKINSRIIVAYIYKDVAVKIMCEAYKEGLYGPRFVWILHGALDENWWKDMDNSSCSPQQIADAVEGHFSVEFAYLNPNEEISVSGWRPSDFQAAYNKAVNNRKLPGANMASSGYDTTWAFALALNNTRRVLMERGNGKGLENFTYEDSEISQLLYSSFLNLSFTGIRGPIGFQNGTPVGVVRIGRVQGGELKIVGYYYPFKQSRNKFEWNQDNPIVWEGGSPPSDSLPIVTIKITASLYITFCLLGTIGILLSLALLAFNIIFRRARLIKLSSPRLNNVILLGCLNAYVSIFIHFAGANHGTLGCKMKLALTHIATSMTFGGLFAKTWRVHMIFSSKKVKRKVVTDWHLFGLVFALMGVNLVLLAVWFGTYEMKIVVKKKTCQDKFDAQRGEMISLCELLCQIKNMVPFQFALYGMRSAILLWGVLLAFETRNVQYPELNDSKYIGICIYNMALISVLGILLFLTLVPGPNVYYLLESTLILLATSVTIGVIFVPKVPKCHFGAHGECSCLF